MFEIRFHGRGGQGAKTASRIIGTAAFLEGNDVQDFPIYGAERRGAPVVSFTRISQDENTPIEMRGYIFEPDAVVVLDESLFDLPGVDACAGVKPGGFVIVNTRPNRENAVRSKIGRDDVHLICIDVTSIALDVIGKPIPNAAIIGAIVRATGIVEFSSLKKAIMEELGGKMSTEAVEKNVEAARKCFDIVRVVPQVPQQQQYEEDTAAAADKNKPQSSAIAPPITIITDQEYCGDRSLPIVTECGNSIARKTGQWRLFRPTMPDRSKCVKCRMCFIYCPDSCISLDDEGYPEIDYEHCKGCLICVNECKPKALVAKRETRGDAV